MCGITGFWSKTKADPRLVLQMADRIKSRGPDDTGSWHNSDNTLALAHRRLSIVDLSPAGHQPMLSNCKKHVIVFNGEIYNSEDLRLEFVKQFGQFNWRGHSDTEVLLNCLKYWGLNSTLTKLNGMFAFAYWNDLEKILYLARDRIGEKPLYYGHQKGSFLFGSELKAMKPHPSFNSQVDRDSLCLYMRHSYVPAPYSIYKGINKLKPAHYLKVTDFGKTISEQQCYWDLNDLANRGMASQISDEHQVLEKLDVILKDSIKRRMVADVSLGTFLSGGYDSTTIAALMQTQSDKAIKTFSIGFHEDDYNEAQHAKDISAFLGTDHTELYVEPKEAMSVIPKLPEIYDEPFADSSQIPTFLVSQLAKQHVTVALSGDGGDELFCGYKRYFLQKRLWNTLGKLPAIVRPALAFALRHFPSGLAKIIFNTLPCKYKVPNLSDRLPKLAEWVNHKNFVEFYRHSISHHKVPEQLVLNSRVYPTEFDKLASSISNMTAQEKMLLIDALTYLPGDILTKIDRASMAVSLETRVPFLDHRLIEFSWRIPISMKVKNGQGKWPLRQLLYNYVPKEMMERPKQGFGVPIEDWLKGPLREWAEELLDERKLSEQCFLDPLPIREMWADYISGKRRWHYYLWDVLMFQAWLSQE